MRSPASTTLDSLHRGNQTQNPAGAGAQSPLQSLLDQRPAVAELAQLRSVLDARPSPTGQAPIQRADASEPSLPESLKAGMEQLSGISLDAVRVHYDSPKPATLQAHAYAQGPDIYLGPRQEQHLPHELGHVVQQLQGRVRPTTEVDGVAVNDDQSLEDQATRMGEQALQRAAKPGSTTVASVRPDRARGPIQAAFWHVDPRANAGPHTASAEQQASVGRLRANPTFVGQVDGLDDIDESFSMADANRAPTGVAGGPEDVFVMAHGSQLGAGANGDQPWMGGMEFPQFAAQLTRRYGGSLVGQTLWLMTCLVGGVLDRLAAELVTAGIRDVTVLAPDDFMFVSDQGIPHVYGGDDERTYADIDEEIAREDANYLDINVSSANKWRGTGLGWAGVRINGAGAVAAIPEPEVVEMVLRKFTDLDADNLEDSGEWDPESVDYANVLPRLFT